MIIEVSKPHFHPSKDNNYTKKRDLSVPPHWVANERIEKDGKSYAVIMPPRNEELFEDRQALHIHIPAYVTLNIKGKEYKAKVKVHDESFSPVVHIDSVEAELLGIKGGEEVNL